ELGDAFESSRLLDDAARLRALDQLDGSLAQAVRGDLTDDQKLAAPILPAPLGFHRGDLPRGPPGLPSAARPAAESRLGDDAAFASIEALEAAGHDGEASREWLKWEKRFPTSPLLPAARLGRAWNALRRGEYGEADGLLQALATDAPWIVKQPRYVLARAFADFETNQVADALAPLRARPPT